MRSEAETVDAYLSELPDDRRQAITAVRQAILDALPDGLEETIRWGMISYEVPLSTCPDTYNGQPLMYAALASQKRHMAVYLTGVYANPELQERFVSEWKARGTRLDMGKSCVRFRGLDQMELDLVSDVIGAYSLDEFIALVQSTTAKK
jgi:uncharacterized protein YdhG (YjbR/CyaY superfamily)